MPAVLCRHLEVLQKSAPSRLARGEKLTILPLSRSNETTRAYSRYSKNMYACLSSVRQAAGVSHGFASCVNPKMLTLLDPALAVQAIRRATSSWLPLPDGVPRKLVVSPHPDGHKIETYKARMENRSE